MDAKMLLYGKPWRPSTPHKETLTEPTHPLGDNMPFQRSF